MNAAAVRLSRRHPVDGTPNPYRTRWFEHEGAVFVAEAEGLETPWVVNLDLDLLHRFLGRRAGYDKDLSDAILAWVKSDGYWSAIEFRLLDVRTTVATLIDSDAWPAVRDTYVALRRRAEDRGW